MNTSLVSPSLSQSVVTAIRAAVGSRKAALHEPTFQGNEWNYVKECLDSSFVSSVGKFVDRFESNLAAFTGAKHAVAVVNGTAALHVALKLVGVQPEDEVLVPAFTFIATANAVAYCGAMPHFVDVESRTLGIDAAKLRKYLSENTVLRTSQCINRRSGRVIRALVPMHTFGHPADMDGLLAIAHDFKLELVEDAAESLGSSYRGGHTGTFGRAGTLSFNGNKTITTGGGGALLTNDAELARHAKHLTTTARIPHAWEVQHDEIGYNYRLPGLNAALGCAQLEQLPSLLGAKRELFQRYRAAFAGVQGLVLFSEPEECVSNYWLQTLILDPERVGERDSLLGAAIQSGFACRPSWTPIHYLKPYQRCPRMNLSEAESLARRVINLPSSPSLISIPS